MAMDILSVQAFSVASESAFSTNAQSVNKTHSALKLPLDVEEGVFNVEVQQNEATQLTDQEIALDASSDGSSGEPRHDYMMSSGVRDDQTGDGHDRSMSHGYY
ncbi:zinc finger BED domain-containing protein RICESLEEPER 2 [Tanacetum coccineum]